MDGGGMITPARPIGTPTSTLLGLFRAGLDTHALALAFGIDEAAVVANLDEARADERRARAPGECS